MKRLSRVLPIIGGAVAGGAIALAVASGGSTTSTSTTTVYQASHGVGLPTSLSTSKGLSVGQIYRQDAPGVVDITVTQNGGGNGFFGSSQQTQGEGTSRVPTCRCSTACASPAPPAPCST